jgi:hypothetical protein
VAKKGSKRIMWSLLKRIFGKKRINLEEQKAATALEYMEHAATEGKLFNGEQLPFDPSVLLPKKKGEK